MDHFLFSFSQEIGDFIDQIQPGSPSRSVTTGNVVYKGNDRDLSNP